MDPVQVDMEFAVPVCELAVCLLFWFFIELLEGVYIFLVSFRCGGTSRENNTYFESGFNAKPGDCRIKICPINDGICQVCMLDVIFS